MPKQLSKEAKLERRRTQRRKNIATAKEEQYIAEYIRYKYTTIYEEAAAVCQQLKAKYPDKINWRKTAEHRAWLVNGAQTEHPIFYTNAILATNLYELRKAMNRASIHMLNPTTRPQTATTLNAMQPKPQIPVPQPSPEPQIPVPQPSPEPQIPVPQPSPEPQIPVPQPSPEPQIRKSINTQHYSDNLQLVIPLIKPPVKQPGLITQTLEITTEEVIGEDGQLVKFDEIDPEIIENVIEELRKDPDLKDVFANVEQEFEIDMNMDIDIELDTRLEEELNWQFW